MYLRQFCNNYQLVYIDLLHLYCEQTGMALPPIWKTTLARLLKLFHRFYYGDRFVPEGTLPRCDARRSQRLNNGCRVELTARTVATASTFFFATAQMWNLLPAEIVSLRYTRFSSHLQSACFESFIAEKKFQPVVFY